MSTGLHIHTQKTVFIMAAIVGPISNKSSVKQRDSLNYRTGT
jgi:hypothetical protein